MTLRLSIIAGVYVILLGVTGYFTFVRFVGLPTVAQEEDVKRVANDEDLKKDLLDDVRAAPERNGDLIKLSAHSFDVVLGALLGFPSASAARLGITTQEPPHEDQATNTAHSSSVTS